MLRFFQSHWVKYIWSSYTLSSPFYPLCIGTITIQSFATTLFFLRNIILHFPHPVFFWPFPQCLSSLVTWSLLATSLLPSLKSLKPYIMTIHSFLHVVYTPAAFSYTWWCIIHSWGGGESGFSCWWGRRFRALVILILLECIWNASTGLAYRPSLLRYWLPGFSSASGGLSPWLNGSTLGDCLPFPYRE